MSRKRQGPTEAVGQEPLGIGSTVVRVEPGQAKPVKEPEAEGSAETPRRRGTEETRAEESGSEETGEIKEPVKERSSFNQPNKRANGLNNNPAYQRYLRDHRIRLAQLEAIGSGMNVVRPTKYW